MLRAVQKIFNDEINKKKDDLIQKHDTEIKINIKEIEKLEQASTVLFEFIKDFGFSFSQVENILENVIS